MDSTEFLQVNFEKKQIKNMTIYIHSWNIASQYFLSIKKSDMYIHKEPYKADLFSEPISLSCKNTTIMKGKNNVSVDW